MKCEISFFSSQQCLQFVMISYIITSWNSHYYQSTKHFNHSFHSLEKNIIMYRKLNITFKFSHQTSETSTWFLWVIVQTIDFAVFRMKEGEREKKN